MSRTPPAALALAARGFHVLPVKPGGKTPLTAHGHLDATTDPDLIRKWWTRWPDANIGISCGPSGIVVLDIDITATRRGDIELEELEAENGRLPYSLRSRTGSGGTHIIFSVSEPCSDFSPFFGIDVRGSGYIVAPPSVHKSGNEYTWLDGGPEECPIEPAPAWLLAKLRPASVATVEPDPSEALPDEHRDTLLDLLRRAAFRKIAGGESRHGAWLWLCNQARDGRIPSSTVETLIPEFLEAFRQRGDARQVDAKELHLVLKWTFSKTARDPHPAVEKYLLPDLVAAPASGGLRESLIRRFARMAIPTFLWSQRHDPRLIWELVRCINDSRCNPPLTEAELHAVFDPVAMDACRRMEARG